METDEKRLSPDELIQKLVSGSVPIEEFRDCCDAIWFTEPLHESMGCAKDASRMNTYSFSMLEKLGGISRLEEIIQSEDRLMKLKILFILVIIALSPIAACTLVKSKPILSYIVSQLSTDEELQSMSIIGNIMASPSFRSKHLRRLQKMGMWDNVPNLFKMSETTALHDDGALQYVLHRILSFTFLIFDEKKIKMEIAEQIFGDDLFDFLIPSRYDNAYVEENTYLWVSLGIVSWFLSVDEFRSRTRDTLNRKSGLRLHLEAMHNVHTHSILDVMDGESGSPDVLRAYSNFVDGIRKKLIKCQGPGCVMGADEKKMQICSRCKTVRYCSRKCQKSDWKKNHKFVCKKWNK